MHCDGAMKRFENEVLSHNEELLRAARRLTRSRSESEDLLQEAVLRAWSFWHRFQPGTNARAWMHRILVNTFINRYRKTKRERELLGRLQREKKVQSLTIVTPGEALSDEVRAALKALPVEFHAVVVAVDLEGLSYQDAALKIGCPVGTVMSRLHRARHRLRTALVDFAAEEGYISFREAMPQAA